MYLQARDFFFHFQLEQSKDPICTEELIQKSNSSCSLFLQGMQNHFLLSSPTEIALHKKLEELFMFLYLKNIFSILWTWKSLGMTMTPSTPVLASLTSTWYTS